MTQHIQILLLSCIILRKNNYQNSIRVATDNSVTEWIRDNCDSQDLFLTNNYFLNGYDVGSGVIASGASMYNAWEYFGWSAGYDTLFRDGVVANAYGSINSNELFKIIEDTGFDYAIIDRAARESEFYTVNEALFDHLFEVVFIAGEGDDLMKIYDLSKKIN